MTYVSSTSAAPSTPHKVRVNRPDPVQVGTVVWLASELMFFAAVFAMFFTMRSSVPSDVWAEGRDTLNITFATINTAVLVSSSFTCQAGVRAAERFQAQRTGSLLQFRQWGSIEWMTLTYILGAFFIGGQVFEYVELIEHGLTISSNPFGSIFFFATGLHGIHVLAGLVAFLYFMGRAFNARKFGHHEATMGVVVSYYWHFVDVVWIALFAVIYLVP